MPSLLYGDIFLSLDSLGISLILLYTFAFNDLLQKKEKEVKELPKQHTVQKAFFWNDSLSKFLT